MKQVEIAIWLGALCYWLALPPFGFVPLIFLVPFFWTKIMSHAEPIRFRTIYFASFVFWLASIWWIACPHPLTSLGLLALAAYLAFYWLLFFAASRIAVHRFRIPVLLAIPISWMGCEFLRNHLLGGFSFCSLEHALYRQPLLIQIADIGGGYWVGGMIMLVGTGLCLAGNGNRSVQSRILYGFITLIVFCSVIFYGVTKTTEISLIQKDLTVALCQGNIPVRLNSEPEQAEKTLNQYVELTYKSIQNARKDGKKLDLIIWSETVCPIPLILYNKEFKPADFSGWTKESVEYWEEQFEQIKRFVDECNVPILIGLSTLHFDEPPEPKRLNSALLIETKNNREHSVRNRYDKIQLVMFGEYIPFSEYLPNHFFLKTLCQEAGRGTKPVAIPLQNNNIYFSTNICFESSIPHFVRNQILTLKKQGQEPSFLVNISNDGWFWFSQQIDQHLATHVFRAVENRRPYFTATHGGFSAIIDSRGKILKIGKRKEAESVIGTISATDFETPIYHRLGDIPAFACMIFVIVLLTQSVTLKLRNNWNNRKR